MTDLNAEAFNFCQYAGSFGLHPTKTEAEMSGPVKALARRLIMGDESFIPSRAP